MTIFLASDVWTIEAAYFFLQLLDKIAAEVELNVNLATVGKSYSVFNKIVVKTIVYFFAQLTALCRLFVFCQSGAIDAIPCRLKDIDKRFVSL